MSPLRGSLVTSREPRTTIPHHLFPRPKGGPCGPGDAGRDGEVGNGGRYAFRSAAQSAQSQSDLARPSSQLAWQCLLNAAKRIRNQLARNSLTSTLGRLRHRRARTCDSCAFQICWSILRNMDSLIPKVLHADDDDDSDGH